jgi:hypothetical protein
MKIINFNEFNLLREELNEFVVICNNYKYTPTKDEFDDVIRFILLQSGSGSATLCESYEINPFNILNYLYESYGFSEENCINEEAYDPQKDTESAVGLVVAAGGAAAAGVAGAAIGIGKWIQYLFKKKKAKKACAKELDAEVSKIQMGWNKLAGLKKKLSALTGETSQIEWPGMAQGGGSSASASEK